MPGLKAVIIDDERDACSILKDMLHHSGHFSSIISFTDPEEGLNTVMQSKPEVLFLDIQMPGITGIDIINQLEPWKISTKVVFVTAFAEYGLEAAKNNVFDYLLKPVGQDELNALIKKLNSAKMSPEAEPTGTMPGNRLLVWSAHGIEILNYDDIVFLEADKNYMIIETCRGENILSSRSLGRIETGLPHGKFARISRKHIVNEKYLKSVNFKDKTCILESGQGRKKLKYTRKLGDFISEKDEPACKS